MVIGRTQFFRMNRRFSALKRKNRCKIWRLQKEKWLQECLQQTNTSDGGKVGIWGGISGLGTKNATIYTGNMNEQLYYDVLQNKVKEFLAKAGTMENYFPTRPEAIGHFQYREGKAGEIEAKCV